MSNSSALLHWRLNKTQNITDIFENYFQLIHLVSSVKPGSNNNLQRVDGSFQQQDNQTALITLTAEALSLGFYFFALSSRSSFQLRCLKNGIIFWSRKIIQTTIMVASISVLLPVTIIIALTLAIYKECVQIYLNRTLLCGADAVWALDANEAKSKETVTVLITLDGDMSLKELKQIVKQRLLPASQKLHLSRVYSVLGYFFWEPKVIDIAARVRVMEGCVEGEEMTEDELRARVSNVSSKPLPELHSAGWEVLLGPRISAMSGHTTDRTAIIFRVHHSVGDGTALCRMLISAVADPQIQDSQTDLFTKLTRRHREKSSLFKMINDATTGVSAQLFPPDQSPLHGKELNGDKQVSWRGSVRLMDAARRVRVATGASFTAGLLAALTSAVADYATARGFDANQKPFTVVVPARIPGQLSNTKYLELDNSFSFALVRTLLPCVESSALVRVQAADAALKGASQPATLVANSWALRIASGLLPQPLASKVLYSGQCTAVMSNMPGPPNKISLAGRNISDFAFFVPHRGTTGVGASAFSYAGKLTLALAIDSALVTGPDDTHQLTCLWEQHLLLLESSLSR